VRIALGVFLLTGGCVVDELTQSHPTPGGMVHAALAGGADHECSALGDGKDDPFTINGFSSVLTFGLVGATDSAGASVHADVNAATALASITVPLGGGSASQLEIHLDGSGCVATGGELHLHVDAAGRLQGDFAATGTVTGSSDVCNFYGGFADVPLDR